MSAASVTYPCAHCGALNRLPVDRLRDRPLCGRCKRPVFPESPIAVGDRDFEQRVEGAPIPVLVDFWAPWCAPCRMVAPVLEDLARRHASRLVVAKLNVDENPRTARRFGVTSIPALKIFKEGRVVDEAVGAMPRDHLALWVAQQL